MSYQRVVTLRITHKIEEKSIEPTRDRVALMLGKLLSLETERVAYAQGDKITIAPDTQVM